MKKLIRHAYKPLFLALAAVSASSVQAITCTPGNYTTDNISCIPASVGYFVPTSGATSQTPAPAGRYVSSPGQTTAQQCSFGMYQPQTAQASCLPTSPGTYVNTLGATIAQQCLPGFYQPNLGQTTCNTAGPGSYVASAGASLPTTSAPGFYVNAPAQTAQTACAAGFTSTAGSTTCFTASAAGDTDADGFGDIPTWNTTTGNGYQYLMSSNNLRGAAPNTGVSFVGFLPSAYTQVALADFNQDLTQDVLLRNNSNGTWALLEYAAGAPGSTAMNVPMSTDLANVFVAAADFNNDGYKDVLLRNSGTGAWTLNLLQGDVVLSSTAVAASLLSDWQKAAVADFNGDGNADLLLRNTVTNAWFLYEMNGATVLRSGTVAMAGAGWNFAGAGDFNADGIDDVLLRRTSDSSWYEYTFNDYVNAGTTRFKSSGAMGLTPTGAPGLAWSVLALADVDGSGSTDLLLYRSSDRSYFLYGLGGVTGRTIVGSTVLPVSTNAAWSYQTLADYNGDGKLDFLLRNTTTGVPYMYGFSSYTAGSVFSYQGYATAISTDLANQIIK